LLTKGVQYSLVFIKGSSSRARLCGFSILYEKDEKPYSRLAAWEMNHLIKTAKPAWRLMELHLIRATFSFRSKVNTLKPRFARGNAFSSIFLSHSQYRLLFS
jgi:hypothetical protein